MCTFGPAGGQRDVMKASIIKDHPGVCRSWVFHNPKVWFVSSNNDKKGMNIFLHDENKHKTGLKLSV